MAIDERGHTAPAPSETPRRRVFNDLSLTTRDIVAAANATDRTSKAATLASALSAAGLPAISASNPVLFRQQDTGEYWEYDGTTWKVFAKAGTGGVPFAGGAGLSLPTGLDYGVGFFNVTEGGLGTGNVDSLVFPLAAMVTMHVLFYLPINEQRAGWIDGKNAYVLVPGKYGLGSGGTFTTDRFSLSYALRVTAGQAISFGWRQESGAAVGGCTVTVKGFYVPL